VERNEEGLVSRVWLSAATGVGLDLLRDALVERFGSRLVRKTLDLTPRHGRARAELYRRGAVLSEALDDTGGWRLEVELSERDLADLERREGLQAEPGESYRISGISAKILFSTGAYAVPSAHGTTSAHVLQRLRWIA
jgi:GTP-binding protein HflX